jgi:hypothetical protein
MIKGIRNGILVATGFALGLVAPLTWGAVTSQAQTGENCQTFQQTGHRVCGKFLDYWNTHGGLAQQGFPISEPFMETSELNGKPYLVQYFERAVFELHPENQPPNDVLLSQLGTYLGSGKYTKGFPSNASEIPFYEDRTDPVRALLSYYNAINRKEYERAYSYFQGSPDNIPPDLAQPYQQWVQGYANTTSVTVAVGHPELGAGAGNIYASMPVVLTATHTDGSRHVFAGCYVMHRVSDGISPDPNDELWSVNRATLSEVPENSNIDQLLTQNCMH